MEFILEPFADAAKHGIGVRCSDGAVRTTFPAFPIVTHDLEEQ